LFWAVKTAFGYTYPNYDVLALAREIATTRAWQLTATRFYTGVPSPLQDPKWHGFWSKKLAAMGSRGVFVYQREMRYSPRSITLPDGTQQTILVGREKGIDIRLALDLVRLARENQYNVALIFAQDQDLSEAVDEVKAISMNQARWIKVASAFPISATAINRRGINGTEWIPFDQATYDKCRDPNVYS